MKIEITESVDNVTDLIDLLNHITSLVEQGYTQGFYPHWKIINEPE